MKKERRYIVAKELRVDTEDKKIRGYAAVFDEETQLGPGYYEVVRPGAFAACLDTAIDCRALWNHNADLVMGRTKSGTLTLTEDDEGLRIEINPPDTETARHWVESISRGDVDQMSFGFKARKEAWVKREDSELRELLEVDVFDVSPVTYPAYDGTSVAYRSADEIINERRAATEHKPEATITNLDPQPEHEPDLGRQLDILELSRGI